MNPIEQYRKTHPENVVWSPENGWRDQSEDVFIADEMATENVAIINQTRE